MLIIPVRRSLTRCELVCPSRGVIPRSASRSIMRLKTSFPKSLWALGWLVSGSLGEKRSVCYQASLFPSKSHPPRSSPLRVWEFQTALMRARFSAPFPICTWLEISKSDLVQNMLHYGHDLHHTGRLAFSGNSTHDES